ncbi:hypothetical protein BGZ76_004266 [Entomortierella beljakovae]|nr:hypothetical protein BGZ76_004266 [Entomortierella beljakovae]
METIIHPLQISPPSSSSSTFSTSSSTSSSPPPTSKSVQFSRFIKISFTYPGDEYDRSALEPARLSPSEASELIQMRQHWKNEADALQDALEDPEQSVSVPSSPSSCSSPQEPLHPFAGRIHTQHLLLQPATCTSSQHSPPCSPVLSQQDSCSSSDDDEYDSTISFSSLSAQQQQQYQRLKRFGSSRNGMNAMMQQHSHLDRTKTNVQCIA